MKSFKFSFVLVFALGFVCLSNGNPISNFFGKSSDDKAEAEDKAAVSTASTAKAAAETTTATPGPTSSCGGLKGFLHICDKNEPTEPPKIVKTRSVSEEDDSDEDDDDDSKSDEDESEEKTKGEEEKQGTTESSSAVSESTEGVAKRQVGDPEAPILGEIPPVVADSMVLSKNPEEDEGDVKKRQVDESEPDSDEEEINSSERRRRDCRDRGEDYEKDCRKKREFVPSCFGSDCKQNETTDPTQ